jgi:hypothetical protein
VSLAWRQEEAWRHESPAREASAQNDPGHSYILTLGRVAGTYELGLVHDEVRTSSSSSKRFFKNPPERTTGDMWNKFDELLPTFSAAERANHFDAAALADSALRSSSCRGVSSKRGRTPTAGEGAQTWVVPRIAEAVTGRRREGPTALPKAFFANNMTSPRTSLSLGALVPVTNAAGRAD